MGIDLVVCSLTTEWSAYADSALGLASSLERLAPLGTRPPPYDEGFGKRAFREASAAERSAPRASVTAAVEALQTALTSREGRAIRWKDVLGDDDYRGQLDPRSMGRVCEIAGKNLEKLPNLGVLDISTMYLPVELPTPLSGQPRSIGSIPGLLRELATLRGVLADELASDEALAYFVDELESACRDAMDRGELVFVAG